MELRTRVQVGEKGRIVIPVDMREALGIKPGDTVDISVKDYEVRISTMQSRLRRAQESVRSYVPVGVSLADELSAERREAARHE
jgi:AbrB family looped-hinge helix DNA binding protein